MYLNPLAASYRYLFSDFPALSFVPRSYAPTFPYVKRSYVPTFRRVPISVSVEAPREPVLFPILKQFTI